MPYPNEHAARQTDPGQYIRFRRMRPEGFPAGIDAIFGVKREGGSEIQSIRANAKQWTVGEFRAWLKEHDFKTTIEPATGGDAADLDRTQRGGQDGEPRTDVDPAPPRTSRVRRFDRMPLRRKPRRDKATGFLRVEASLTRAPAVFAYRRADGTIRREFRAPEHVFASRNLDSVRGAVVTNDHPNVRVTRQNVSRFQVGQAEGEPTIDNDVLGSGLVVTNGDAIEDMERGKRQISLGYDCDLVLEPGIWTDAHGVRHPYDAIQTNHETNHIAIVHEGRAGPEIRAYMDSTDAIQLDAGDQIDMPDHDGQKPVSRGDFLEMFGGGEKAKVDVNGVAYDLPVATAQAVADALAANETKLREAKASADRLEAERDSARQELKDAKAKIDEAVSQDELRKRIDARLELERRAEPHFDAKEWPEARKLDDTELRRRTVAKVHDGVDLEGKSDEYIAAAFDLLPVPQIDDQDDLRRLSKHVIDAPPGNKSERNALEKTINDQMRKDDEAWKRPIPGGYTSDGPTRHKYAVSE